MMKLKRFCAGLAALCMMGAVVPVLPVQESAVISASAEDEEITEYTYENFKYTKSEDYVEITGYVEEPTGELVIPAEIDSLPVSGIKCKAFEGCEKITSLTIPDTLTIVGGSAFICDKEIKRRLNFGIAKNQLDIETFAFYNCINLSAIHVSETHPTLSSVDGVLFNKDKTEIICYPVGKADKSYEIPNSVVKIMTNAFFGSQKMTSIILPKGITSIGYNVFYGCSALESITIPDGVTSIGHNVFYGCSALKSITIPDGVTNIENGAFSDCSALESITIPDGVTSIGDSAFYNCSSLESVTIPESVTNIESRYTFYGTLWMKAKEEEAIQKGNQFIIINNNLIWVNPNAGNFKENKIVWDVVIPDGVTNISNQAFEGKMITSVAIPESVTHIGNYAFDNCNALDSVTIKNPDCEIPDNEYTISNTVTIYGYENSTAQAYAEKYGRKFESLGSAPDTTEPKTEELKQGDADGNGEIDILDVITINKAILGKEILTENGLKAIDFNGNGKPDSDEALTLLKYIVGIITSFN